MLKLFSEVVRQTFPAYFSFPLHAVRLSHGTYLQNISNRRTLHRRDTQGQMPQPIDPQAVPVPADTK